MKTLNIILLVFAAFLFNACGEKFLDAEPITTKTDINYYSTPAEAQEALVGCYDAMQLIYHDGVAIPNAANVMADLCFGGTGSSDADNYAMIDEFDMNREPGYLNLYEQGWINTYKAINRCNNLILKIDQIECCLLYTSPSPRD